MKVFLHALAAMCCAIPATFAAADDLPANEATLLKRLVTSPDSTRRVPLNSLNMMQLNGITVFASDNGRYVITGGTLTDLWHKQKVNSVADFDKLANRIPWKTMKFPLNDLAKITYGSGSKEVLLFIDPLCGHCHDQLLTLDALKSEFKFHVIMLPVIGQDKSTDIVMKVLAEKDKAKAFDALTNRKWEQLTAAKDPADEGVINKTMVTARVLGVDSVPVLISPNGKMRVGAIKNAEDFKKWLKAEES